jgi:hypothetical protein
MAFGAFQKSSQDFIASSASSHHPLHRIIRFIASSASSHHPLHRIIRFWVPAMQARPVRCGCSRSVGANGFLKNMPDFRRGGHVPAKADVARAQRST